MKNNFNPNVITDPSGKLNWCIGTANLFWCLDYHRHTDDDSFTIHAEKADWSTNESFEEVFVQRCRLDQAIDTAIYMEHKALQWLASKGLGHDSEGWGQDETYFSRCVQRNVESMPPPAPYRKLEGEMPGRDYNR